MTAVLALPVGRGRTGGPGRALRLSAGRLLRLELRRSAMLWVLPLIAALFWFDCYRTTMATLAPVWSYRAMYLENGRPLLDLAPFVTGAAAWTASRDGRLGTGDQVAATSLPRWAAQLAAWAAGTCWALIAYASCIGALYGMTARQGAVGEPLWWPVLVNAAGVVAFSAVGFAAGALVRSRFTVPLAGMLATFLLLGTQYKITHSAGYGLVSPMNSQGVPGLASGGLIRFAPDLSIVQIVFLVGLAALALGVLGLRPTAGGLPLRATAVAVTLAGLAALGTGLGLAGTAQQLADGNVGIPALHSASEDAPTDATPVCTGSSVPICLDPHYRAELPALAAALDPVLAEVSGLPGAPVRVTQATFPGLNPAASDNVVVAAEAGRPPVLRVTLDLLGWLSPADIVGEIQPQAATRVVVGVVGTTDPAQQAVAAALLTDAGIPLNAPPAAGRSAQHPGTPALSTTLPAPVPGSPESAAVRRFAALSPAARHAWLAADLGALRAGRITLEQLP